jgi:hypothetical protein
MWYKLLFMLVAVNTESITVILIEHVTEFTLY